MIAKVAIIIFLCFIVLILAINVLCTFKDKCKLCKWLCERDEL